MKAKLLEVFELFYGTKHRITKMAGLFTDKNKPSIPFPEVHSQSYKRDLGGRKPGKLKVNATCQIGIEWLCLYGQFPMNDKLRT